MKSAIIFTLAAIVCLSIVSGSVSRQPRHDLIIPRPDTAVVDPFAPIGLARNLPKARPSLDAGWHAQQGGASGNPNTAEWTTTANPPVVPSEYNGDVRDLPQISAKERPELEMYEAPATRSPSTFKGSSASRNIVDAANNVPLGSMPAPAQSFQGLSLSDDCAGSPCGIGQPPDVNGDVGLDHYIEAVNFGIAIYSKTGNLLARFSEDSLWHNANTGTPCDQQSHGDPVVVYDQFANRWIISNFAFGFNSSGPASPFYECFAVSKTGDPISGGWWFYPVRTDSGDANQPPVGAMADYPKFGNWNDGCLYMSANNFTFPGGKFVGTLFGSFNKSDMENGQPLTSSIGFISDANTSYSMIPSNLSGAQFSESLPAAGTPNYYVAQSRSTYSFEVRKFTPGTSPKICGGGGSMGAANLVAQAAWVGPEDISQPNANPLGSLGDRMMQKIQYRKVGTKESLWIVHSVEVSAGTTVRSQWAQIDVSGGAVKTTPVQQQIYAPDTTIARWVPSIAADHDGNVALGYNTASSSKFPSIAYSGRLATDPLNQLSQEETELIAGQGSQRNNCEGGPCRRWGDYSAMSVDPVDDCTFWYVNQYYASQSNGDAGNWQTRIGSFKFPSCGGHLVTHTLSLQSSNPDFGVPVTVDLDDENNQNNGIIPFTRTYRHGYTVRVTTDPKAIGNNFLEWQRDGVSYSKDVSTTVVMDGDHTMKAVYDTTITRSLNLHSTNPNSGVTISLSPGDVFGVGSGQTGFEAKFAIGSPVTVRAPSTAGGNVFKRWMVDGYQWDTATSTVITLDNDHDMTAVYEPVSTVSVTVQTNPTGANFTVDGASYSSSQSFSWAPNSTHTIATDATKSIATGTQLAWSNWSDGGAISHTVTATGSTTYTANLTTQYLLTINDGDGGLSRPITGFYDANTPVSLTATAQPNFFCEGWTGTGLGSFSGPFANGTVLMKGPITETVTFTAIDTSVQFSSSTYSVNEADGIANITVTRNGPPTTSDDISWSTSNGTAVRGKDYLASVGVLTFNKGESSKTFPILIVNNSYVDGPRTVNLQLTNAQGALLGTPNTAVLTIVDDDNVPGPNPIDDPHSFVQFQYYDFLNRYPDTSGWDFWTNQIKGCGTDSNCVSIARTNTSAAFFLSIEFQETGYEVERLYKAAYGDATGNSTLSGSSRQIKVPMVRFFDFLVGKAAISRNLVVGQDGWQDLLEANKQLYARSFVRTDRFIQAFPSTLTPAQYVDQLNQNAGSVLSDSERSTAIALFSGAADSNNFPARVTALRQVAENPTLVAAEKNRAFVLSQYFGYLRRNPDDPPDKPGDYTGYDFWLTKLNQFNGDFKAAQMVEAFLNSSEYRHLFGP